MSTIDPGNPYDPGADVPLASVTAEGSEPESAQIRYLQAYGYVFENSRWMATLLAVSLWVILTYFIIGLLVLMGYQFEIVESLHRHPRRGYPAFDFSRFSDYLSRGVWPFLIQLIVNMLMQFVVVPLIYIAMILLMALAAAAGDEETAIVVVVVVGTLFFLMGLLFGILLHLFLTPMLLRAGLSQDFGAAFRMSWIWDFIRRMWVEMVLVGLFMTVSGMLVLSVGSLIICVGALPAMALVSLANAHFYYQLYRLYLARGGEPIPLKEPPMQKPPIQPGPYSAPSN